MKTKTINSMVGHAHHNYKVPQDIARSFVCDMNLPDLKKEVRGAIKSFIHSHYVGLSLQEVNGLEKRITGALKVYFARLLLDRLILNWLCKNRIDLSTIDGELRNGIIAMIQKEYEKVVDFKETE